MQLLSVRFFAILEFIGTTELLVVLFVALLVFGPRKLPGLGRSLGQALNQLRNASDDFKQTWEAEALQEGAARSVKQEVESGLSGAADAAAPSLDARPAEANG